MSDMISIIIPAYNAAGYLAKTIESVLNQTYSDFELLLIDDGSTDRTHEIVKNYQCQDARIKYFYKENGGVSSARNMGLQKAIGDFVSFLDSDDFWDRRFLESMYRKLVADGKLACFCGYIEKRGDTEIKYPNHFEEVDVLKEKLSVGSFRIHTDCWLIDRKFLSGEGVSFTEGCHYMEDLEFFVKLLFKATDKRITYVPEYLSYYVLRKNSLSYQDLMVLPLPVMQGILDVLKRIYNWIEAQDAGPKHYLECVKILMRERYIKFLWDVLLLGDSGDFKTLLGWYGEDKNKYISEKSPLPFKYKIWSWAVFLPCCRFVCLLFLRPYIQHKRKAKMHKLNG